VDALYTPHERAFATEVRDWLAGHLTPEFRDAAGRGGPDDDDGWEIRRAWERELASGGWLGVQWPREYGGRAASAAEDVILQLELGRAGAPSRAAFHGETLLAPTLLTHGTPEQKTGFLPAMARSETVWAQGYSEPGAGSDLAALQLRAVRDGDDWVLDGQKIWTTFAQHADWMFLLCRTEPLQDSRSRHRGITYLLCPLDQPGIDIRPICTLARGRGFNEVWFSGARARAANVIGAPGDGWQVAMATLGHERATSILNYQFSFARELDQLVAVVRKRGLEQDPVVRQRLMEAWTGLEVLRHNTLRTLARLSSGQQLGPGSSITKLYWSRWHQRFCQLAMDLLGPEAGLIADDGPEEALQQAFLRAPAETIYAGTTEVQKNILSERVLGLPREPVAPR
jgi:alkylation response protein AidB-like acyl-CoA dehydrogenase